MGSAAAVRAELEAVIAGPTKATVRDFAGQLGKLALHFWRPDFTPEQAKHMYGDFVQDLDGVTTQELADACREWRTDPLNRFFPTPGKLLELVREPLADRARAAAGARYLLEFLASDDPAGDAGHAFDPAAHLRDLAEKMRAPVAKTMEGHCRDDVSTPARPAASTARAHTDAAELRAHIDRRAASSGS